MGRNSSITIGETEIKPGERVSINLPVADLYTSTSLSMPVEVISGRSEGPVLFVSAAMHGDELNGVEIIRRLLKRKVLKSIRGTLIAVPVVNVHGFLDLSRYLPDRRDLNRSFPGSAKGSIAARLANLFVSEVLEKSDYGIDLHTGAINRGNLPQIRGNLDKPKLLELAKCFGAPVVINADERDGSLRACAADRGIPYILYEAGEALRFDELSIRAGIRGILNVMRHIGMLPEAKNPRARVSPVLAHATQWVRAVDSGIVVSEAGLGTRVKKGQTLALITDPLGSREDTIVSPFDGIVIGCSNLPLAHEGDALFNLAAFEDVPVVEDRLEEFAAVHNFAPVTDSGELPKE